MFSATFMFLMTMTISALAQLLLAGFGMSVLATSESLAPCPAGDEPICSPEGTVGNFPVAKLALEVRPVGNAAPTRSALFLAGKTNASSEREFLVALGLDSITGARSVPPNTPYHDKVTLYTSIIGKPGTGDIWAINPLVTQEPNSGEYTAQGIELDFNNNNAHRGDADGGAGLTPPNSYGLAITGAGGYRSTSALLVSGPGSHPIFNRGMVFANNAVAQSTFQDLMYGHNKSIDIRGQPTWGIYQSNSVTKNYFAGKMGLGVKIEVNNENKENPDRDVNDAQVVVGGGDLLVVDHTVRVKHGMRQRATVLGHSDVQELVHSGNVVLGVSGTANVTLTPAAQEYWDSIFGVGREAEMEHVYALTSIGAPAPYLHVSRELWRGDSSGGGSGGMLLFTIAGGPPGLKVSWTLRSRPNPDSVDNKI